MVARGLPGVGTGWRYDQLPDARGQAGELVVEAAGRVGSAEPANVEDGLAGSTGPSNTTCPVPSVTRNCGA